MKWGPSAWKDDPFEYPERQRSRTRKQVWSSCHFDREISVEDGENRKSFKLFLALDIFLSEEEEESNDDS